MRTQSQRPGVMVRLARAASLHRCEGLTRAQRLARAFFWLGAGAGAALFTKAALELSFPAPAIVNPMQPAMEQRTGGITVIRFPFESAGVQISCHVVIHHEGDTWLSKC